MRVRPRLMVKSLARLVCVLPACVLLACVLSACGGAGSIAEVDLLITVTAGRTSVATGEGFPLTVTRIWRKDIEPSPWDDGVLSPLVVRPEQTQRREDRLRVEETRTFRAYAFTLESVSVPPVLFVGRSIGGSGKLICRSEALPLRVTPALDQQAPGAPEYPEVPEPLRPTWPFYLLGAALAVGLALYLVRRHRAQASRSMVAVHPVGDPQTEALAQLARLSARGGEPVSVVAEVADILRHFVGAHYGVPVTEKASEEVVAALPSGSRASLRDSLAACDRVKFAAHRPSSSECAHLQSSAATFVRTCGSERA